MALEITPDGRFGTAMFNAMKENNLDLRQLAEKVEATYEHMRKLVRGLAFPSSYLLKAVCAELNLRLKDMQDLIAADKIEHTYGDRAAKFFQKNPELTTIEKDWEYLSTEQKDSIRTMVSALAQNNMGNMKNVA